MIERIFRWILVNPKNTLTLVAGSTAIWTLFIPSLKIDFSIEHLFSKNDPAVERYFSFRDSFGREDNVITIIYEPDDGLRKEVSPRLIARRRGKKLSEIVVKDEEMKEISV